MAASFLKDLGLALGRRAINAVDHLVDIYLAPDNPMVDHALERAATYLRQSQTVLVCAGSGLSAESGVPTFRGEGGIFRNPKIATLTNIDTFYDDREAMLKWYQERRDALSAIDPNDGHRALIRLAKARGGYTVATQNVDHLLEAAGDEQDFRPPIIHLHGSLLEVHCHDCDHAFEDLSFDLSRLPACERCEGPLRPGVVWFGESLPDGAMEATAEAARQADICLIVGTSGLVQPAASVPEMARHHGAKLIEINPNPSALSDICDVLIRQKAGRALPSLAQRVLG